MAEQPSSLAWRALQWDLSRGRIPRVETLIEEMEFLKPYGFNAAFLYLECVVQCRALPTVRCGRTPVTKRYLQQLLAYCRRNNISLAPIFQVMGHQWDLLALPKYRHLGELRPGQRGINNFRLGYRPVYRVLLSFLEEMLPFFTRPFSIWVAMKIPMWARGVAGRWWPARGWNAPLPTTCPFFTTS